MAVKHINKNVTYHLIQLLVIIAGLAFIFLVDNAYRSEVAREYNEQLTEAASVMQRHLAVELNKIILVVADLRAFLLTQSDPPDNHYFASFSTTLQEHYPALDALAYIGPDRLKHEVYPLTGNESVIDSDANSRIDDPDIEKAIRDRKLIVSPPHTMSNGHLVVIARLPMFRGEKFVGFAQAIFRIPDVVQGELADLGSEFAIQLRDENGNLFLGADRLTGTIQRRQLVIGDVVWTLSVAPSKKPRINGSVLALIWCIGSLLLLLLTRSACSSYRTRLSLTAEVAETTRKLRQRNEKLEQQMHQRKEAETRVLRSEQSLRLAQQIAHLGNWDRNLADDRLYWSDELYRIFGNCPQAFEPTFEHFLTRVHPEDRAIVRAGIEKASELKAPIEFEYRIILPDGDIRYVQSYGIFEYDAQGRPQRTLGTVQDITAQKLVIKALEESDRKYRAVLEHASDGIIITSAEGRILDVNRCMQTLLGYSREELLVLHLTEIYPPEDAEKLRTSFASMQQQGFSLAEHELLCKNGTITPVEVAVTLITLDHQQLALGIFRDIRERKRVDAELQQYRNHLEKLVEQRTMELEALNNELEAFSYSVSHDLRAPLRAIKGFSAALSEDCAQQLSVQGRNYLERIHSASDRMGRLIDDLLHLSATLSAELHCQTVSLSTLATDLIQDLKTTAPERKVCFIIAEDVFAQGDPTLLRSLLQNLLDNAWKFTRSRPTALIEFGTICHDGNTIYFVRDNGIGFEMNHAQKLFEPFYRLHDATIYEGNGIGLSTVQRIVQRHAGQIWAESGPGEGTTFYFMLGTSKCGCQVLETQGSACKEE